MSTELVKVPFHGGELLAAEGADGVIVPIKPICDRFGIDANSQRKRLNRDQNLWRGGLMTLPSAGGEQEMFCLPLQNLAAWLFSITISRVKEEYRERMLTYQREAADVLDAHFRLRRTALEDELALVREQLDMSNLQVLVAKPVWSKFERLWMSGRYDETAIRLQLRLTLNEFSDMKRAMQDAGIIPIGKPSYDGRQLLTDRLRDLEDEVDLYKEANKQLQLDLKAKKLEDA
ncbi:MAG: phage antirepressor N-terminal domain-containing protein [Pseudomonadota bacterium]